MLATTGPCPRRFPPPLIGGIVALAEAAREGI